MQHWVTKGNACVHRDPGSRNAGPILAGLILADPAANTATRDTAFSVAGRTA